MQTPEMFEPALYSLEENQFLADHAGEPSIVALQNVLPAGVNPKAVRPVLERFFELEQLRERRGVEWVGIDAIKESCLAYINAHAQWSEARRKGAPFPPTMYEWDQRGRAHRGAVGADSGYVRTYYDAQGNRRPLGLKLESTNQVDYVPEWVRAKQEAIKPVVHQELIVDDEHGLVKCPICEFTVNYEAGVQSKLNQAKHNMGQHLIKTRKDPDSHRILHAAVFGASS